MPTSDEIYARLTKVLVQALSVEQDDIKPSATLQGDLGAESIDFLDILFRLENEFRIRIPRGELFPEPLLPEDPAFVQDSRVTDAYLAALRSRMPYADLQVLERDRRLGRIEELFTVELMANYIEWKLGASDEANHGAEEPVHVTPSVIRH
jgi:acyl carrier protein